MSKIDMSTNEYGSPISVHRCPDCGDEFTVCPPVGDDWGGCLAPTCKSYDPDRDMDSIFNNDRIIIIKKTVH